MLKTWKIFLSYWWQIILLFLGLCLQVFANLTLPDIMSHIINEGISKQNMDLVWSQGLQMLAVVLIGIAGMIIAGFFASKVANGFATKLRETLFRKILSFSINEIDKFSTASLITRTTQDITILQMTLVMILRMSLQAPIMAIGAISMALTTAPNLTWIIALVVTVLFALVIIVAIFGLPKFRLIQQLNDDRHRRRAGSPGFLAGCRSALPEGGTAAFHRLDSALRLRGVFRGLVDVHFDPPS